MTGTLRPTTMREALQRWQDDNKDQNISEAKEVLISLHYPPIDTMDTSLNMLTSCEKLSLSTNMIERINGLARLRNLKHLALGRNNIRNFNGLEVVAGTLQVLWISYNQIERMRAIIPMKKLKQLYMAHNLVKDWAEFGNLAHLPLLEDLIFLGNPLEESYDVKSTWRDLVKQRLPNLQKLDGEVFI